MLHSILIKSSRYQIIKTDLGYFRVDPLPYDEELVDIYVSSYYLNPHGNYQASYSEMEVTQRRLRIELIHRAIIANLKLAKKSQIKFWT